MVTKHLRKAKGSGANGKRRRVARKPKRGITRAELLADTEDDAKGGEEFVKLLHELRRERALAALEGSS